MWRYLIIGSALFSNALAVADPGIDRLFQILQGKIKTGFTGKNCATVKPAELIGFFLMGQPLDKQVAFNEQCDVEGNLHITQKPFNTDLKLRKLDEFDRTIMKLQIDKKITSPSDPIEIKVRCLDGKLYSSKRKRPVLFDGYYSFIYQIGASETQAAKGGFVHIKELDGKKVNLKREIRSR